MTIVAYRPEDGESEVKEYMRYTDHSFIVDGVARLSLPETFWEEMAQARIQKAKNDNSVR